MAFTDYEWGEGVQEKLGDELKKHSEAVFMRALQEHQQHTADLHIKILRDSRLPLGVAHVLLDLNKLVADQICKWIAAGNSAELIIDKLPAYVFDIVSQSDQFH